MRETYDTLHGDALDPNTLELLQGALNEACAEVGNALAQQRDQGAQAKEIAARAIISIALEGARDRTRLRKIAVQALTRQLAA